MNGFNNFVSQTIVAYHPGGRFPALSVTGGRCEQQCDHCQGHYLKGMGPATTPGALMERAAELERKGARGFLLSGGCDGAGRVPLAPFVPAVREIKERTSLLVNLHTGLVDGGAAAELLSSGADCFSVDVVQDRGVIREALHLEASPQDYAATLEALSPAPRLVPHICVGLQSKDGERRSLELVAGYDIAALVVLGLAPARGTPWDGRTWDLRRLPRFVEQASSLLDAPVLVGCMRPRGQWEVELECIKAGAAGIVNPSSRAVEGAMFLGYAFEKREECCSFHR